MGHTFWVSQGKSLGSYGKALLLLMKTAELFGKNNENPGIVSIKVRFPLTNWCKNSILTLSCCHYTLFVAAVHGYFDGNI